MTLPARLSALLTAAAALAMAALFRVGHDAPPAAAPPPDPAPPAARLRWSPPPAAALDAAALRARPPFSAARRPPPPQGAGRPLAAAPPPGLLFGRYEVAGVVKAGGAPVALLRDTRGGALIRLRVGDPLGDAVLTAVSMGELTFRAGAATVTAQVETRGGE